MTSIILIKTLPSSNYYTGSGATTITLKGVQEFVMNTKKVMIKIKRPKSKARQLSSPTDQPDNKVIDLQRIDETMVIKALLEDDSIESAWNKAWKLRAMCTRGGPLTSLTIGETGDSKPPKLIFDGSPLQQAFLEDVTFTIKANDSGAITIALTDKQVGRIEVGLTIYFGDER